VRPYSTTAAVVMTCVALIIPPIAAIVANAGDEASRRMTHPAPERGPKSGPAPRAAPAVNGQVPARAAP
jgi:hypothetical protein